MEASNLKHNYRHAVVSALYREADRLEQGWASAGLAPDFRDRMVDAVLRFVAREEITELSPRLASRLLTKFWNRNGKRDAARNADKPRFESLSDMELAVEPDLPDDSDRLIDDCRNVLIRQGLRREVAEAFLQDTVCDDPMEVVSTVRRNCSYAIKPDTLRQWRVRYFGRAADILREHAAQLGIDGGLSRPVASSGIRGVWAGQQ